MKKLFLFIVIILFASCKLFEPKDTTDPIVNFTIKGGNEISREVTLYLNIEDERKIESVSIIIDDTTAFTVESHLDTIQFDVTPFADESEHTLYATVEDSESNIGESNKIDVVITEFPGWRIYNEMMFGDPFDTPIVIDQNGTIIIGSGFDRNGLFIFDPETNELRNYNGNNSPLVSNYVIDIVLIEDGKIWIANQDYITEYIYDLNIWGRTIKLPLDPFGYRQEISSVVIDNNYDLWVGTWQNGLFHYISTQLQNHFFLPDISSYGIHDLVVDKNNRLFVAPEINNDVNQNIHGVFSLQNGVITNYEYFTNNNVYTEFVCIAVDSNNTVWAGTGNKGYKFNGSDWSKADRPYQSCRFDPMFISSDEILYMQDDKNGLIYYNGNVWNKFSDFDTPFHGEYKEFEMHIAGQSLAEAPNGDIWMVAGGKLMRYRPSLVEYP